MMRQFNPYPQYKCHQPSFVEISWSWFTIGIVSKEKLSGFSVVSEWGIDPRADVVNVQKRVLIETQEDNIGRTTLTWTEDINDLTGNGSPAGSYITQMVRNRWDWVGHRFSKWLIRGRAQTLWKDSPPTHTFKDRIPHDLSMEKKGKEEKHPIKGGPQLPWSSNMITGHWLLHPKS